MRCRRQLGTGTRGCRRSEPRLNDSKGAGSNPAPATVTCAVFPTHGFGRPQMKVLLVGVGGVGEAIAVLTKDKPWVEKLVLADYNVDRAKEVWDEARLAGSHAGGVHRCRRQGADRGAGSQARGRSDPQRGRPGVQRGHLRRRVRGGLQLHGHGDDPVHCSSHRPVQRPRRQAGRLPVRAGRRRGRRRACLPSWAWAWSRAWRTCSPSTPRRTSSTRSRRSACATAPTWRCGVTSSPPTSPSGPPSRNASTLP